MNNRLLKTVGVIALVTSTLQAEIPYTNALFGIEGGYSSLNYKYTPYNGEVDRGTTDLVTLGLKVGAETQTLRTFVNINYYHDASGLYDYLFTSGVEVQYKFVTTAAYNFYAGVNAGYSMTKLEIEGENFYRTINAPYVGASVGADISLSNTLELEAGAKLNAIQADNTKSQTTYKIENLITGYIGLIYKWKMD